MSNTETTKPMGTRYAYRDLRFDELIVFFAVLSRLPPLSEKDRERVKKAVENLKKRAVIRMSGRCRRRSRYDRMADRNPH